MERRKIQQIGGTSYSISLPKSWIRKNKLTKQSELIVEEKGNGELRLSPNETSPQKLNDAVVSIDDHGEDIEHILYALNNIGVEKIKLFSKTKLDNTAKSKIRRAMRHMSGAEIISEDNDKVTIRVLLDKKKIEMKQVLTRLSLVVEQAIHALLNNEHSEVVANESDSDRLYNLAMKITHLSLLDSTILESSGTGHVALLPSYFLIAKKLENIADETCLLSDCIKEKSINKKEKEAVESILETLTMMRKENAGSKETEQLKQTEESAKRIDDKTIDQHIKQIIKCLHDIHEARVVLTLYKRMIDERTI